MNVEKYRDWMNRMGFDLNFEWLIEISAQAGMLTGDGNTTKLTDSFEALASQFSVKLLQSKSSSLLQATFVRTGEKNPPEHRWLQCCIILLTEALKYQEDKIVQVARDTHIIPAMVYLAIAILVKDRGIQDGIIKISHSREVDYNYLRLVAAV